MFNKVQYLIKRISGWPATWSLAAADMILPVGDETEATVDGKETEDQPAPKPRLDQVIDALVANNCCKICVGKTSVMPCWWCRGGRLPGTW